MAEAYIVEAVRTPTGRRGGGLAAEHPADLAGAIMQELFHRSGVDPSDVDDVIVGCVAQIGSQAWTPAATPGCGGPCRTMFRR